MTEVNSLSGEDHGRWFDWMTQANAIHSHLDLFAWLRGGIQHFLPHEVLLAAWGDFQHGELRYDVVSALPEIRTAKADAGALAARMRSLFALWTEGGRLPRTAPPERMHGVFGNHPLHDPLCRISPPMRTMLVHGLRDERSGQDCLYAVLRRHALPDHGSQDTLHLLLPCIDAAMRQVPLLPTAVAACARPALQHFAAGAGDTAPGEGGMTSRELQIMQWVEMGKTNQEIGTILNISAFTVKNHLQRIFKKLDVYNRAQAVSRFKDSYAHG